MLRERAGTQSNSLEQEGKTLQRVRGRGRSSEGPAHVGAGAGRGERRGAGQSSGAAFGLAFWFSSLPCKSVCTCRRQEKRALSVTPPRLCRPFVPRSVFRVGEEVQGRQKRRIWGSEGGPTGRGQREGLGGEKPGTGKALAAPGIPGHFQLFAVRCCCFGSPVFTENLGFRHRPCI